MGKKRWDLWKSETGEHVGVVKDKDATVGHS